LNPYIEKRKDPETLIQTRTCCTLGLIGDSGLGIHFEEQQHHHMHMTDGEILLE
jgi:hypothetical protein